jgi:hypothetical protein
MLIRTNGEACRRAASRTVTRVRQNIIASGRVNTGRMLGSVSARVAVPGIRTTWKVSVNEPYTIYQEKGIGPVTARPGGFLVFTPKGSSTVVFAKRTRGFEGAHFLEKALRDLRVRDYAR